MKGKFEVSVSLMQLKEILNEKQPYSMLVVSTTGLDSEAFNGNMPTRVYLEQYSFDEELKQYKSEFVFDKLVECGKEALEYAINNKEKYDVFKHGDINEQDYINGKNVLTQGEFKKEFDRVMDAVKESNSTLILNGGMKHCHYFLEKINCGNALLELNGSDKILNQTRITQEYFKQKGISEKVTLENLRNAIASSPTHSFISNEELMNDFKSLPKEDFLKNHTNISEKAYDVTKIDYDRRNSEIIGAKNRVEVINNFMTFYGREVKALENEYYAYQRESYSEQIADLSRKGKENYKSSNLEQKIDFFINKKIIDVDKINNGESEYHKLVESLNDTTKKGIIILHTATTGMDSKAPIPQRTGFPIQITMMVVNKEWSKMGDTFDIKVPNRELLKAEETAKKGGFDIFADAGIDIEKYKSGDKVVTVEKAIDRIENFFKKYPIEDYTLITLGGTNGTNKSFAQVSLENMGNLEICNAPSIDLTQAIKEYTYIQYNNPEYKENVLFDVDKIQKFGIKDIAEANGVEDLSGTKVKCCYVIQCIIKEMSEQYNELFKEHQKDSLEVNTKEQTKDNFIKADNKVNNIEEKGINSTNNSNAYGLFEAFQVSDGASLETTINIERTIKNSELDVEKSKEERFRARREELARRSEAREQGRLYSDKINDKADVVVGNVEKVGEVNIPHVSEAFKNQTNNSVEDKLFETIKLLTETISEQKETIKEQNKIIQKQMDRLNTQSEQIFEMLQQQNEIMRSILSMDTPSQPKITQERH